MVLPAVLAGGAIAGGVVQGYFNKKTADAQMRAAEAAARRAQAAGREGQNIVGLAGAQGAGYLNDAYDYATDRMGRATNMALNAADRETRGAYDPVTGLQSYIPQAAQAVDVSGMQSNRLAQLADRDGGLFGGFENDPGYQFRQQQGEQAINRANAARGGRLGGAALKELAGFNQGLASQEFQNFQNRRMQEAGVAGQIDARNLQSAGLAQQAGLARQSVLANLANQGIAGQRALAGFEERVGARNAALEQARGQLAVNRGQSLAQLGMATAGNQLQALGLGLGNSALPVQYAGGGSQAVGGAIQGGMNNLTSLYALSQMGALGQ